MQSTTTEIFIDRFENAVLEFITLTRKKEKQRRNKQRYHVYAYV